MLEDKIISNA